MEYSTKDFDMNISPHFHYKEKEGARRAWSYNEKNDQMQEQEESDKHEELEAMSPSHPKEHFNAYIDKEATPEKMTTGNIGGEPETLKTIVPEGKKKCAFVYGREACEKLENTIKNVEEPGCEESVELADEKAHGGDGEKVCGAQNKRAYRYYKEDVDVISPSMNQNPSPQKPVENLRQYRNTVPNLNLELAEVNAKRQRHSVDFESVNFIYKNHSLYAISVGEPLYIGNFALIFNKETTLVEEIVNEENNVVREKKTVFWEVTIQVANNAYNGSVSNENLSKLAWIRNIARSRAIWEDKSEIRRLLLLYINQIINAERHEKDILYNSCGWKWIGNNQAYYLTSNGTLGREDLPIKAVAGFELYKGETNVQQAFANFMAMRKIIQGKPQNAVLLQHYMLMSSLTSFFKKTGFQIEYCVALIGKTNTKKTTCGEIFTRVFKRTKSAVPEINFSATEAAIFEIMDHYADAIVMIDDLTPSENDANAREKMRKLESIIRSYGDRIPRRRSTTFSVNREAKEFIPARGCALITGEEFSGIKSSRSRVIQLKFDEGDVNNDKLAYFQENLHILPDFIYHFLNYATNHVQQFMNIITIECTEARKNTENYLRLPRYIDAFGTFCAISRILYEFMMDMRLLDASNAATMLENDRRLILQVIQENDNELSTISQGAMYVQALKDALDRGQIKLYALENVKQDMKLREAVVFDENFYYIPAEQLWQCVKQYTDYRRIFFPYRSGKDLIKHLKEENLLFQKLEGSTLRSSHKLVINGKTENQRFLYLFREKVEQIWTKLEQF